MIRVLAVLAAILVPAVLIWTLGHFTAGLIVGGIALAVICWYGYRAALADRERRRRYRETVWARRDGPFIEWRDPNDPPIWPRWTLQPGTPYISEKPKGTHQ